MPYVIGGMPKITFEMLDGWCYMTGAPADFGYRYRLCNTVFQEFRERDRSKKNWMITKFRWDSMGVSEKRYDAEGKVYCFSRPSVYCPSTESRNLTRRLH